MTSVNDRPTVTQRIFFALGTVNTLTCFESGCDKAIDEAVELVRRLHDKLSFFDGNSEISRIYQKAGVAPATVSAETLHLMANSIRYAEMTGGMFDITTGGLSVLWKKAIANGSEPTEKEIHQALSLTSYKDILIDETNRTVMLRKKGQSIDLGAIAKGYAADAVRSLWEHCGLQNAIINLGGTVTVLGQKTIGLQNPFQKTGVFCGKLLAEDTSVVTAGVYEQCRQTKERLIHHIIDPKTGFPSTTMLRSVTLTGTCAEELDALSTAVLLLGIQKSLLLLKDRNIEGLFITHDGKMYATAGMKCQTTSTTECAP